MMSRHALSGVWWAVFLAISPSAQAGCEADNYDVARAISGAEAAWEELDVDDYARSRGEADNAIRCLVEPLTPANAAAFHGMQAIGAFLERNPDHVVAHYRAAVAADPDYRPVIAELEGHPLEKLFAAALHQRPSMTELVFVPKGHTLLVGGNVSDSRPLELPAVYQLVDDEQSIRWNGHLTNAELMPDLKSYTRRQQEPANHMPVSKAELDPLTVPLAVGSGAAVVTSGVLMLMSNAALKMHQDPLTPYPELEDLRKRANGTYTGAALGAVAALGLGAATISVQFN